MESRYTSSVTGGGARSSDTSDDQTMELIGQSRTQRHTAKSSFPESEIRKAKELMKGKNNHQMLQYVQRSRRQITQKQKISTTATTLNAGNSQTRLMTSPMNKPTISMKPVRREIHAAPLRQQSMPSGRKISTHHGQQGLSRQSTVPPTLAHKKSLATFQPAATTKMKRVPPAAVQRKQVMTYSSALATGKRHKMSVDSLSSMLSIISQNM